ncbi:MAG: permease [Nanoarchaeota archaeon]
MKNKDLIILFSILFVFLLFFFIPTNFFANLTSINYDFWLLNSITNALELLSDYAKKHILTCLLPALFIAGAIAVFIRKDKVLKYLGDKTKKYLSYSIAAISGGILAVCSCTILPLFAGIRKNGAGLGPAITFLFSGPAINVAAIFLTINVLGLKIGIARIFFAIILAILIGLTMSFIFREQLTKGTFFIQNEEKSNISKFTLISFFLLMLGILIVNGLSINQMLKYIIMGLFLIIIIFISIFKFKTEIRNKWLYETWSFSKLILPLLFIGIFIAGFIMPILPEDLITNIVGKNTIFGNFIASIFGAFMYFSTLTEIPILHALISKGMHYGPALALLLAGPSLSLPNMLVIRKIIGTKKTLVYISLVIFYSTIAGFIFGSIFNIL